MTPYTPSDWYWIVGSDETQVYSSKIGVFVGLANATYIAWLALGNLPFRIGTHAELGEVLAAARVTPAPIDPQVLTGYQDALALALAKAANANLMLHTLNVARSAAGEQPISQNQFAQFIKDNSLT